MFELEDNKSIFKANNELIKYCEQEITHICKIETKIKFIHDKKIKEIAKIFNINIKLIQEIYTAVRYFELQPNN